MRVLHLRNALLHLINETRQHNERIASKAPFTLGNLCRQQQTPTSLPICIADCLRVYTGRRCAEVGVALLCDAACDVRR